MCLKYEFGLVVRFGYGLVWFRIDLSLNLRLGYV